MMLNRIKVPLSDLKYIQSQIEKILNLERNTGQMNINGKKNVRSRFMRTPESPKKRILTGGKKDRKMSELNHDEDLRVIAEVGHSKKKEEKSKSKKKQKQDNIKAKEDTKKKTTKSKSKKSHSIASKQVTFAQSKEPSVKLNNHEIRLSTFGNYEQANSSNFFRQEITPRSKRSESLSHTNNSIVGQANTTKKIGQLPASMLSRWQNPQNISQNTNDKISNKSQEKVYSPMYRNVTQDVTLAIDKMQNKLSYQSPHSSITSREVESPVNSYIYQVETPQAQPYHLKKQNNSPLRSSQQFLSNKYAIKHSNQKGRQTQLRNKYHVLDQRLAKLKNQVRSGRVDILSPQGKQKKHKKLKELKQLRTYERYSPIKKLLTYSQQDKIQRTRNELTSK